MTPSCIVGFFLSCKIEQRENAMFVVRNPKQIRRRQRARVCGAPVRLSPIEIQVALPELCLSERYLLDRPILAQTYCCASSLAPSNQLLPLVPASSALPILQVCIFRLRNCKRAVTMRITQGLSNYCRSKKQATGGPFASTKIKSGRAPFVVGRAPCRKP